MLDDLVDENDVKNIDGEEMSTAKMRKISELTEPVKPAEPVVSLDELAKQTSPIFYPSSVQDIAKFQEIQERCRQLCLSLFYREQKPVCSLGFTSASRGEGRTFLSIVSAEVLANELGRSVVLVECNWEGPCLHEHFKLSALPGLAEWLRGECDEGAIHHRINRNLTVIPAGSSKAFGVQLLQRMQQRGLQSLLTDPNALVIVDLPPILGCSYGALAARVVESLVIVAQVGKMSRGPIERALKQIKGLSIDGIVLNQVESCIPLWLQQLL